MSVTAAHGFTAAGVPAGLKGEGRDLALVVNTGPQKHAAAVFTSNRVAAAPVLWSRQAIDDGRADAVVLNSGGANACTGSAGFVDAHRTAEHVAEALQLSAQDVLVCSTGLIGVRLDMEALLPGVDAAVAALSAGQETADAAADAIRTTDSVSKTSVARRSGFTVGGMAKGAGMLAPGLATMLAVITTDAVIDQPTLDAALREAVRVSFDRADSDGCMSTNDTVVAMASGARRDMARTDADASARGPDVAVPPEAVRDAARTDAEASARVPDVTAPPSGVDVEEFQAALTEVCRDLAAQLIADAEGAAHEIAITTVHAADERDAETAGRAVARSNLFKTAIFGRDPNWGRILSAVGTTDVAFDPDTIDVAVNGVTICRSGGIGEDRDLVDLSGRRVEVIIDLKAGDAEATILTNDLTHDYVHENSAYSS